MSQCSCYANCVIVITEPSAACVTSLVSDCLSSTLSVVQVRTLLNPSAVHEAMAAAASTTAVARLSDGRLLRYLLWKAPAAAPAGNMLHFHGWPSSAEEGGFLARAANQQGLNLACFDRPGVGGSSLNPNISYQSVADDACQLLLHLGWASNPVLLCGASGGGPYAAACAALLPTHCDVQVAGLVLYASMTHTAGPEAGSKLLSNMDWGNRLGYAAINYLPWTTRAALAVGAALVKHVALPLAEPFLPPTPSRTEPVAPEPAAAAQRTEDKEMDAQHAQQEAIGTRHAVGRQQAGSKDEKHCAHASSTATKVPLWRAAAWSLVTFGMAAADRQALWQLGGDAIPHLVPMMRAVFNTPAYGQGLWQDMRLTSQPWDFSLQSIKVPTLVFQGTADVNVTVGMAEYLAQHIPGAHLPALAALHPAVSKHHANLGREEDATDAKVSAPAGLILMPGEGHMSLGLNHAQDIMRGAVGLVQLSQKQA